MSSHNPTRLVLTRAQLLCLASPLKKEIVDAIRQTGPASIAELAAAMERSPKSLYYHLRQFVEVGLMRVKEIRRSAKRDEAVYELAADHFVIEAVETPEYAEATARSLSALLRKVDREFRAASTARRSNSDETQEAMVLRLTARLNQKALEEVRAMLQEVSRFIEEHDSQDSGVRIALTTLLTTLPRRLDIK